MSIFVLADPHLSFGSAKPMDVFSGWADHAARMEQAWRAAVRPEDTVVLPGDISWAMSLDQALPDFQWLNRLPGVKLIMKGNHDYWWNTRKKIETFWAAHDLSTLRLLHNSALLAEGVALCGSRGWFFDDEAGDVQKVLLREAGRLRASIRAGKCLSRDLIVFLHYPPIAGGRVCDEIYRVLREEGVSRCYYGHLHGEGCRWAFQGRRDGIDFRLISADSLGFAPLRIPTDGCALREPPRWSAVVPFYQAAGTLRACADSVLAQTEPRWELILVDDGSTDAGAALADELAAGDARIRVLHQKNRGVSAARNAGLAAARGEYVSFLDADDWLEPAAAAELLRAAADGGGSDVVTAALFCRNPDGSEARRDLGVAPGQNPSARTLGHEDILALLPEMHETLFFHFPARCCYRRSFLLEQNILFTPALRYGEDTVFCLEACLRAERVRTCPAAYYHYCPSPGSASQAILSRPDYVPQVFAQDEAKRALADRFLPETDRMAVHAGISQYNLRFFLPLLRNAALVHPPQEATRAQRAILRSPFVCRALREARLSPALSLAHLDRWIFLLTKWRLPAAALWLWRRMDRWNGRHTR
ncbi:MAG: glycosyltransferase [Oscillospiraceae bacterium]|nr:glycosyltransferase [Oscillospiraceae bacterium]